MMRAGPGVVAVLIGAMAATIGWELTALSGPMTAPVSRPHPASAATLPAASPDHTPQLVATILARPLFSPDRRPAAGAVATIAGGAPAGLPRLAGVLVTPAGRAAIFAAEGQKAVVLTEGGTIAAWTVRAIEAGEVRLSGPDGLRVLHPTYQQPPTAVGAEPAPAHGAGLVSSAR